MPQILRRHLAAPQLRAMAGGDGKPARIVGYAAVFNVRSNLLGPKGREFYEIITPGAFADSIASDDIFAFRDHCKDMVLGRSRPSAERPNTLALAEDEHGLRFECEMPDASYARDLVASVERGDLDGCSFGYVEPDEEPEAEVDGFPLIRLNRARLAEISLGVPDPAYPETEMSLRSASTIEARRAAAATPPPASAPTHRRALRRRYVSTFPTR